MCPNRPAAVSHHIIQEQERAAVARDIETVHTITTGKGKRRAPQWLQRESEWRTRSLHFGQYFFFRYFVHLARFTDLPTILRRTFRLVFSAAAAPERRDPESPRGKSNKLRWRASWPSSLSSHYTLNRRPQLVAIRDVPSGRDVPIGVER